MSTLPEVTAPATLTEAEVYARARALERFSRFDADGILGFLHAEESGPGTVSSLTWLPVVFDGLVGADLATTKPRVAELMIVASCVRDRLVQKVPLVPGEGDTERWASFCAGFVAYAALDAEWRSTAQRWNHAVWAALLAGRRDLLAEMSDLRFAELVETAQRELGDQKANMVVLAHEELRVAHQRNAVATRGGARVGRNDPCPCGSGKKFKKCHLDNADVAGGDPD